MGHQGTQQAADPLVELAQQEAVVRALDQSAHRREFIQANPFSEELADTPPQ